MAVDIVILAAGKGTRMKSTLPKVLHKLAGKPLLGHVIDSARALPNSEITVVIGHGAEQVKEYYADSGLHWVEQSEQLGTAHAVEQALPFLRPDATTLVLYGDVPLISVDTLEALVAEVDATTLTLLTVELVNPTGYGRILRNDDGLACGIVEEKDATELQKRLMEVNTGVMAIPAGALAHWLPMVNNDNAQKEYYLTDLIAIAHEHGVTIETRQPNCVEETEGVNSREQLHALERYYQKTLAKQLMAEGASLADASRFECRGSITTGYDCFIDVNCVFEGDVKLGNDVSIGPNCVIRDATIGDGVSIKSNTVIEGPVTIGNHVDIGPFARLRPGTQLADNARIGNFVETKNSIIGKGSKVNHLSYVGDAEIGEKVNVGAGTITCNYDGVNKFKTRIGDGAFIGSNTSLVAPVSVGKEATVGAGSTITRDVDDGALAVARGKQKSVSGWQRPSKINKD